MLVADQQQTLQEYLVDVNARIDEVAAENTALRAFKAGVPWQAIAAAVNGAANVYAAADADIAEASAWLAANAPKGAWA